MGTRNTTINPRGFVPPNPSPTAPGASASGPPAWDWEGLFGEDKSSVFRSGLAFEDALIIFITLMAREEEALALEASERLAEKVPANVTGDATGALDSRDQEVLAMAVKNHLERKGNLLLLANGITDSFNQTLDRIIQSIGQP